MKSGPDLHYLLLRLQNCPSEFLYPPILDLPPKTYIGQIHASAVVNDVLFALGDTSNPAEINGILQYKYTEENENYLQLILITAHLLHDEWFLSRREFGQKSRDLLTKKLKKLSSIVKASQFVLDSERREELIRFCLTELDLKPSGETDIQAKDRLTTIDSIERKRVIEQSKAAQRRAQQIRDAIAAKEAEEAASKWNRE